MVLMSDVGSAISGIGRNRPMVLGARSSRNFLRASVRDAQYVDGPSAKQPESQRLTTAILALRFVASYVVGATRA